MLTKIKSLTANTADGLLKRFPKPLCWLLLANEAEHARFLSQMYVRIETTNACNAKCRFCTHSSMSRQIGNMDYALSEKIIDECAQLKVNTIWFMGFGEPLLDNLLEKRIKYAKSKGINNTAVITNGALLNEGRILALIDSGLDEINISLDAASKETYQERRINLDYEQVTANIRKLLELRGKTGSLTPRVRLSFIKTRENSRELSDFLNQWDSLVDFVSVSEIHNWGINHQQIRKKYIIPCYRLWLTLVVLWDGRVSLCCADTEGSYIMGDLKSSSIAEIWNSRKFHEMRRNNLRLKHPEDFICAKCSLTDRDSLLWLKDLF